MYVPARSWASVNDTPAARTLTRTSPGPGRGSASSTIFRTSGPPKWSTTTRCISTPPSCLHRRPVPSARVPPPRRDERVGGLRAPRPRRVWVHGPGAVQDRGDDLPRALDGVLAQEERLIAGHRVMQEPLVGSRRPGPE